MSLVENLESLDFLLHRKYRVESIMIFCFLFTIGLLLGLQVIYRTFFGMHDTKQEIFHCNNVTMAAHLGLQSCESSITDFDKTPIYVPVTCSGQKAMIPRFFGCQVSVVEKKSFGQPSIKSKSVWSWRNQLRVPLKVQCIPPIAVTLCYAVLYWSCDFIRVVDSLLLNQT
jgi:hypothetical protein